MHGLYVLYWVREQHVPAALVAAALVAGDVALTLLEVPTGWLADRCGHRASLIAGSILQVAGMLLWWLGPGVPGLFTASLFVALGDAFRSGADQALLYRSCAAVGCADTFQRVEARARAIQLTTLVVLILAGGVIVDTWGFGAGWAVEVLLSVIGLIVALAMIEPPVEGDAAHASACASTGLTKDSRSVRLPTWIALIAPAALMGSVVSAGLFFAQSSDALAPVRMTIVVAAVTLAEAVGAAAARYLGATVRMQLALAGVGAAAIALVAAKPSYLLPTIVALSFLVGLAQPLRATTIQQMTNDAIRARMASIASAADKISAAVALTIAGASARRRRP